MTHLKRMAIVWLVMILAQYAGAKFDSTVYDPEVTNYLVEMHERFHRDPISKEKFEVYYQQLAKTPTTDRLKEVILDIFTQAQKRGQFIRNANFVKSMHALVLGRNARMTASHYQLLSSDVHLLESGQVSQEFLLKMYLETDEGKDRMAEVLEGDMIQQARFKKFKL